MRDSTGVIGLYVVDPGLIHSTDDSPATGANLYLTELKEAPLSTTSYG